MTRFLQNFFQANILSKTLRKIPGRKVGLRKLQALLKSKKTFALVKMHLVYFRNINNYYGHECGDAVLELVARKVYALSKQKNFYACRMSSTEFNVYYTGGILIEGLKETERIKDFLKIFFYSEDVDFMVSVAIGIVNCEGNIETIDEIAHRANIALAAAQKAGSKECVFFSNSLYTKMIRDKMIVGILQSKNAINSYKIFYQPQVDIFTGKLASYEALARIGNLLIGPNEFIPIAELYGFITEVGRIVTKSVIMQLAKWKSEGRKLYPVSINFSPGQLQDNGYLVFLLSLLEYYNVDVKFVKIEITEGTLFENSEEAIQLLNDFVSSGIQLVLDDFGSGYASLRYLTYMPVSIVKLDKSLIDTYLHPDKESFIENIINLIHSLGMKALAEGVEEPAQYAALQKLSCDMVQGFFVSHPIASDGVHVWEAHYNPDEIVNLALGE